MVNYLSACFDKSRDTDESFLKDKQFCPNIRFCYVQWNWRTEIAWHNEKVLSCMCWYIRWGFRITVLYLPFPSKSIIRWIAEENFSNPGLWASQFGFHTDEGGTTFSTQHSPVHKPLLNQPWPNFQISTFWISWVRGNSCCCWKDEKWINCKRFVSEQRRPTRAELSSDLTSSSKLNNYYFRDSHVPLDSRMASWADLGLHSDL